MIRKLSTSDFTIILSIINESSIAYKDKISEDCWKEPYMSIEELHAEIESGVQFFGLCQKGAIKAVMGIQPIETVTLLRHAYTLPEYQRKGLGAKLLVHLLMLAKTKQVLVGTWTAATWAIKFYQNHGFKLTNREETNKLLQKYWNIPDKQIETSVVLKLDRHAL